jgi:hypothetical protein
VEGDRNLEGEEHLGGNPLGGYIFVNFCPVPRDAFFREMPTFRVRRRGQVHARQGGPQVKAKTEPEPIKAGVIRRRTRIAVGTREGWCEGDLF